MKQNKDWTDVMRSALRGTEVTPPADGWARLERELGPHPRISVLRSHWPRIAAAAAAVLIFLGGGGYLLHENRDLGDKGFVIATATDSGSSAADMAQVDGTPAGDGEGTLAQPFRPKRPCGLRRCRARSPVRGRLPGLHRDGMPLPPPICGASRTAVQRL